MTPYISFVLAQGDGSTGLPDWANYGILGLFVIAMLITKQLVPGWIYAQKVKECEELRAENRRLTDLYIEAARTMAAALQESSTSISLSLEAQREAQRERRTR